MTATTKKGDWIELEFSGFIKDGALFDTTKKDEAAKAGRKTDNLEPLVLCIGKGMILKGLDDSLDGKEIGKEYEIELEPKKAYGPRNPALIRAVPLSAFQEMPVQGMWVNVDGIPARVASVTSGRALLDFNPPLAGKIVIYKIKILRAVEELDKKIKGVVRAIGLEPVEIKVDGKKVELKIKEKLESEQSEVITQKIKEIVGPEITLEFLK